MSVTLRRLASLAVFVTFALPATAQVTALVTDAYDGTPVLGLPWRAWPPQFGSGSFCIYSSAPGEDIGASRVDGVWVDTAATCGQYPPAWTVLVEREIADPMPPRSRAGYFAATSGSGRQLPLDLPATQLAPIPVPVATAACEDVVLTWEHALACNELVLEDRGLGAYAVMRSPAGSDAFVEVGRTDGADGYTEWRDLDVPAGNWVYALKLVFGNPAWGVESLFLSANSDPVTIAPPTPREDVATRLREPGGTSLQLDWQAVSASPSDVRHHVYAGDLADVADPATFVLRDRITCGLPRGPGTITVFDPRGGPGTSRYYLVSVALGICTEYYGTDSFGIEHPASASPCP